MIYTARVSAFQQGLSRLSYDETPLVCGNDGCTNHVNKVLSIPGEHIGRPGRLYSVVRCLNCLFWGPYYVYFCDHGEPIRVEYDSGWCPNFLEDDPRNPASLIWTPALSASDRGQTRTFAGGEPAWVQCEEKAVCPACSEPMEFIMQLDSMTMDGWRDDSGRPIGHDRWPEELGYEFYLMIEFYATLFLFICESCRITCSFTQCT